MLHILEQNGIKFNTTVFFEIMNKYVISNKFEEEKSKIIELIVEWGHIDFFRAFSGLIENSDVLNKLLNIALLNRRFDVFKELHTIMNKNNYAVDNKNLFLKAGKIDHKTMLKYLVQFIDDDYFEFKDNLKNSILNLVVSYGDLYLVKYVISLNPTVSQMNNKNVYGIFRFIFTLCSSFYYCNG